MAKKTVKGWAVLKGGYPVPPGWGTNTVWITKRRYEAVDLVVAEKMDVFHRTTIVPCTITYELPTKE